MESPPNSLIHNENPDRGILRQRICPLCSRVFPHEQLYDHINSEHPYSRRNTIAVIQAYHPAWMEDHGACERCWKSFRDAGQALDLLKGAQRPQRLG